MSKTIGRISQKKIRNTQVSLAEIKKFKKILTKEGGFRYYKNRYNDYVSPRFVSKKGLLSLALQHLHVSFQDFFNLDCFITTKPNTMRSLAIKFEF